MQHIQNISAQKVSWVKSNKEALEKNSDAIKNLWYPETIDELTNLIRDFQMKGSQYDLIGYSSNTLFLPSYTIDNLICTKKLSEWRETEDAIICDCGVNVAMLSKEMLKKGYKGFFGLIDLPGTIASGVYGNCGCFDCSVCELLDSFTMLTSEGDIKTYHVDDLKLQFRSTSLKRHELSGTILQVVLKKIQGNAEEEQAKANQAHATRLATQPNAANNLGSTFNGSDWTLKGKFLMRLDRFFLHVVHIQSASQRIKIVITLLGGKKYSKYLYSWNRFMFYDNFSYLLFSKYEKFLKSICSDVHLEIEIRK